MRRFTTLAAALGLLALLAGSAAAQQPSAPGDDKAAARPTMGMAAMHGMMAVCQDHRALTTDVATALAKVREAQASTDPVVIKSALGDADRTLVALQAHFGKCAMMMEKMKGNAPAAAADEQKR